jgi:NAD(P)H-hydrate repair Nnr-like enzyme with NAD(P)H-hydrate epimerase domain
VPGQGALDRRRTPWPGGYDLCIDGIIGFRYRPPLPPEAAAAIEASAVAPPAQGGRRPSDRLE